MSQVGPQVDVGALTINGLAAFSPVLAILSADNVTPLAMVQMENLGSIFHINGEYAHEVPNLLQRYSSTRLDRLGIAVGWRKRDAASLMAKSAGGQAVSLFSKCLLSLYSPSDTGQILHELSAKVLPPAIAISSVSQLVDVAKLVGSKLEKLGFGQHSCTSSYQSPYRLRTLRQACATRFLGWCLKGVSGRIIPCIITSGSRGLHRCSYNRLSRNGSHLGIEIIMMFPHDAFVTLDNLIIHEGASKMILVEFGDFGLSTQIHVESKIQENSTETNLPIAVDPRGRDLPKHNSCFQWPGWIADVLQLAFLDVGLTCPKAICNACCDVLMLLPTAMGGLSPFSDRTGVHIAHDGYESLLGPYPNERMYQICQTVWRTDPGYLSSATSLTDAYTTIQSAMTEATTMVRCSCQVHERCQTSLGWKESRNIAKRTCKVHRLWTAIGSVLHYGFACFFVNAGCNATITHPTIEIGWRSIAHFITNKLKESSSARCGDCGDLRKMVMSLIEPIESVAASSNSSTLYPTALCTLALPREMNVQYSLEEGRLIHNGQYHNSMRHNTVVARPLAKKALLSHKSSIAPSCGGEHSDLMITVRECIGYLEMRTKARVGGSTVHLNLDATIISSWGLKESRPCGHSSATPLDSDDCEGVITTSVASPSASGKKIATAQVQGNPVAQLLCCNPGTRSLIQTDCCLYCALEQAEGQFRMIIVR